MPTIFISYRRADSQYVTDSIYDHMVNHFGESEVFLDVGSIPFGVDFRDYIRDQIDQNDVILVVIGQDWARIMQERAEQANDFVRIEIENALSMNKLVIPVLVKNAEMPDFSQLPASIADLQWRNSAIIRRQPDLKTDCQRLADGIKHYLSQVKPNSERQMPANESSANSNLEAQVRDVLKSALSQSQQTTPDLVPTLPEPFELIEIPNRNYSIGKYPITNAQFARFIEAGGYNNREWWTMQGWVVKQENDWMQPRLWDEPDWNGDGCPVVGVSWFEAVAYCLWLSDLTEAEIMLPTVNQWQYAAQNNDGRNYPWGDKWHCTKCNNSVEPCYSDGTTPVTQFEGIGDSPFGVVDMVGNVWEWSLTDYQTNVDVINYVVDKRALLGGSWNFTTRDAFRVSYRYEFDPKDSFNDIGFRIVQRY